MAYSYLDMECYHLRGERGVTAKIKQAMQETTKQFVYIGFLLWEVKQYEYFYEEGFDNVYEYAESELGFKRSSTKNFIAICENFCRKNEHKLPTMFLDDRWNNYQYSQLTEMLAMSPTQREKTKPSMTVKQLREVKKPQIVEAAGITEPQKADQATIGQTSGQQKKSDEMSVVVNNYWTDLNKQEVKELCFMSGKKFNTKSCYRIEIKAIPKNKEKQDLKRKLCEACHIEFDPANFDYGITIELKQDY